MNRVSSLITGMLVCLSATCADADLILGLAFDDTTTATTVTSGGSVLVDLFLTDTDASTPMSAGGLSSGGGRLLQTGGAAVVTDNLATVVGTNGAPNWFGITSPVPGPGISSALTIAPFLSTVGVGATTIQIARFSLMVTGGVGDTATLTSDVLGGIFTGNVAGIFPGDTNLDAILTGGGGTFGSVTVTIEAAAVPEASTLFMAGLLGAGYFYRRRRKITAVATSA